MALVIVRGAESGDIQLISLSPFKVFKVSVISASLTLPPLIDVVSKPVAIKVILSLCPCGCRGRRRR